MSIRVIEKGPFGCWIERDSIKSIHEIPEGYMVINIVDDQEIMVYIDPLKAESFKDKICV
jgi:hypothetical protein